MFTVATLIITGKRNLGLVHVDPTETVSEVLREEPLMTLLMHIMI